MGKKSPVYTFKYKDGAKRSSKNKVTIDEDSDDDVVFVRAETDEQQIRRKFKENPVIEIDEDSPPSTAKRSPKKVTEEKTKALSPAEKKQLQIFNCLRRKQNEATHNHPEKWRSSRKVMALLDNIKKLDAADLADPQNKGKKFKHFIYSDQLNGCGITMIAHALKDNGFKCVIEPRTRDSFGIKVHDSYGESSDNFGMLFTQSYMKTSGGLTTEQQKKQLEIFNSDENAYGKKIRIMLLESKFKEGIDLYDVKYCHVFEETMNQTDMTQVVGRGTRFCGQKNLNFVTGVGWELQVHTYHMIIPEELRTMYANNVFNYKTLQELCQKYYNKSADETNLVNDINLLSQYMSVDYPLTKNLRLDYDLSEYKLPADVEQNIFEDIVNIKYAPYVTADERVELERIAREEERLRLLEEEKAREEARLREQKKFEEARKAAEERARLAEERARLLAEAKRILVSSFSAASSAAFSLASSLGSSLASSAVGVASFTANKVLPSAANMASSLASDLISSAFKKSTQQIKKEPESEPDFEPDTEEPVVKTTQSRSVKRKSELDKLIPSSGFSSAKKQQIKPKRSELDNLASSPGFKNALLQQPKRSKRRDGNLYKTYVEPSINYLWSYLFPKGKVLTVKEEQKALVDTSKMTGHQKLHYGIDRKFGKMKWMIEKEPKCKKSDKKHKIAELSVSQNFLKHYFTPSLPFKGMLFWHSVGTGKTCLGVTIASASFEDEGYRVLWVTRKKLIPDVTKNIFGEYICHNRIALNSNILRKNSVLNKTDAEVGSSDYQKKIFSDLKINSKTWSIEPITHKQFANLCGGHPTQEIGRHFREPIKGDIFYKTLIIMDEAHYLFSGKEHYEVITPQDRQNIMERLHYSYETSGKDSARLILMTATPITTQASEFFYFMNLCKEKRNQISDADVASIKTQGWVNFIDNHLSGYISYLNRQKDKSQFAQVKNVPHFLNVDANLLKDIATGCKLNAGTPKKTVEDDPSKKGKRSTKKGSKAPADEPTHVDVSKLYRVM